VLKWPKYYDIYCLRPYTFFWTFLQESCETSYHRWFHSLVQRREAASFVSCIIMFRVVQGVCKILLTHGPKNHVWSIYIYMVIILVEINWRKWRKKIWKENDEKEKKNTKPIIIKKFILNIKLKIKCYIKNNWLSFFFCSIIICWYLTQWSLFSIYITFDNESQIQYAHDTMFSL
jgi:hypothetical protein